MKKREFLKSVSVMAAGAALPQLMSCGNTTTETNQTAEAGQVGRTNWAETIPTAPTIWWLRKLWKSCKNL